MTTSAKEEANIVVVQRFVEEVVNGGQVNLIPELWTEDLVWHGGSMGEIHGVDAFQQHMTSSASGAFTEMHLVVHHLIAKGDDVVVRFTNSGTQSGEFMGTPATGKQAEWLGIAIYTLQDGRIADAWFGEDLLGMMLQLGTIALPS